MSRTRYSLSIYIGFILSVFSFVAHSSSLEEGRYQAKGRVTWEASWQLRSDSVTERERSTLWLNIASNHPISGSFDIENLHVAGVFSEAGNIPSYSQVTHRGQRLYLSSYRYDIYPSRAGNYTLPELNITVTQGEQAYRFSSDELRIEVDSLPREAMGTISSPHYTLSQEVTKTEIMSGGVVTRTIAQSASGLPGYLIGQIPLLASLDMDVELTYGRETNSTEQFRGHLTGIKKSNLHYRFLEAGDYELPAMEIRWWNNSEGVLETASINAINVVVTAPPPPPLKERIAIIWFDVTQQAPIWWYQNQVWVYLSGLLLGLLIGYRDKVAQQIQRTRNRIEKIKMTSMYSSLKLMLSALKTQEQWQKGFYSWMRENNIYSMSGLPDIFNKEVDNYHRSRCLNRFNVLYCVVKWKFDQMKSRWNLSDINPK